MSKSSKRRRPSRETTDRAATTDIVSQLECAIRYPQATLIGALVGGVVPWFARTLAHSEVPAAWSAGHRALAMLMLAVVAGCACFSALTVYKFGRATFGDPKKALGFTLTLEGVMIVSQGATSAVALAVLIAINALANGSAIALAREGTCKRREADARRAATRSRNRAGTRGPAAPAPRAPIAVEEAATAPAPRTSHSARARQAVVMTPKWNGSLLSNVLDAEVVSEQKLLS